MRVGEAELRYPPCGSGQIFVGEAAQPPAGGRRRGVRREAPRCAGRGFVGISAGLVPVFSDSPFPDIPDFPAATLDPSAANTGVKRGAGGARLPGGTFTINASSLLHL